MSPRLSARIGLIVCTVLLAALGCGRRDIVPVSGRVTLDSQPLAGAVVVFQPIQATREQGSHLSTGSVGQTDASGRFRLQLVEPQRDGALVGPHAVTITMATDPAAGNDAVLARDDTVPQRWRDGSQRFEVPPGGTDSANFELASP